LSGVSSSSYALPTQNTPVSTDCVHVHAIQSLSGLQLRSVARPVHVGAVGHAGRKDNFAVDDVFTLRVVVGLARPFIPNFLAGAIGGRSGDAASFPRENILTNKKYFAIAVQPRCPREMISADGLEGPHGYTADGVTHLE
jgi:hypothetical protein